ncbi:hypothetical protein BFJ68_g12581 [Fusarium oxysporum]|uniref:NACHT domain-containing protein n=1 Tax=Fusarium oxysporum TaxID=5507 RepID=A0A420Q7B8_FUSOX|nr:hypothetical protein BFJ68_g12581 [Fusarium oxysporum]
MPEAEEYTIGWICALTKEFIAAKAFLDVLHDPVDNAAINDDNNYTLGRIGKHNVVIAGAHGRNSGGVIQYDYGRAIQGKEFTVTGHLNQPPMAFLTAMSALHARYEMEGHSIDSNIDEALQKYKRLGKKYKRPEASTDRLYKAEFVHEGGEGVVCRNSCGYEKLVHRDERDENENNPAIHCGLIASGNQLMKDALLRDELAAKHGILCFEMEAAGLMNHFQCVVIRGICDYCDSHKNDEWQEYAATAAAAYTKDLLLQVAPSSVQKEERIETLLGQVNEKVDDIHQMATESSRDIRSLSSSVHDNAISRWLNPADPSVDHNKAREACHSGTGQWLLNNPRYLTWKSQMNSFLWLNGNSGTGKTILSSTVIEDIRNSPLPQLRNCAVLYFYITFTDSQKQSLDAILRSLINQLYRSRQETRHPITLLYSKCGDGSSQATVEQLESTFRDILSVGGEVFVLIDALDEYQNRSTQRDDLLTWIESFHNEPVNTNLLVTSRPEHDIKTSIETWADSDSIISLKTDNVGRDISDYVRDEVTKSTSFRRWHGHTSTQNDIVNTLTAKADGVFRWVALQLERLKDCINKEEVKTTLDTLPATLQETYYQVINELTSTRRKYVIRILQFLAYSNLPMELEAAVDALAIDLTAPPGSRFIMKERPDEVLYASLSGDQNCVKTLLEARATGDTTAWNLDPALYIASEFGHLETVALLVREGADVNAKGAKHNVLCTAIKAGHKDIIALLIKEGSDVNAQQGPYSNALQVAIESGHLDIIELLIKEGADVNAQARNGTALQAASTSGYLDIVIFLLEKGADVNAQGGVYGTALCAASRAGHLNIVKYLVEKGADVNAQGGSMALPCALPPTLAIWI